MEDAGAGKGKIDEYREYVALAKRCAQSTAAGIVITRGPTGSGKTTRSQALVERVGAIRVRTDVERKRLHGMTPMSRSGSPLNAGLYSATETDRTYLQIRDLTRTVAGAGYPVVVDGTFLLRRHRELFRALAVDLKVPFVIVDFVAPVEVLGARVQERHEAGRDASEADIRVLEHQLRTAEPLAADERASTVTCDAEAPIERSWRAESWQPVLERLHLETAASH